MTIGVFCLKCEAQKIKKRYLYYNNIIINNNNNNNNNINSNIIYN